MKIVIVNGKHEADYIIKMFNNKNNKLIVINNDEKTCEYLSYSNKINVFYGDATKEFILDDNDVYNSDLFIALSINDIENYVSCLLAKKQFNVKKCICTVINPKNVAIFKTLGIDATICSTFLLGESIKNESSLDDVIKTLSLEDSKVVITEIVVDKKYKICGQALKEANFPKNSNISCIYRKPNMIVPNGDTVIKAQDKLVIASTPEEQDDVIQFVRKC